MSSAVQQGAPETRGARLTVRFGAAELARVERRAGALGLTPSAFVRGLVGEATRPVTAKETSLPSEAAEVAGTPSLAPAQVAVVDAARVDHKRVAVNLNQLVRLIHRGELDVGDLAAVIGDLAVQVERLVNALGGKGRP